MKSIKIFAAAGAISLLGMAGLSSCKTNNGPEGPGNYDGKTVKAEFAISIPEAGKSDATAASDVLRMPADGIQMQATPVFQGMDHIVLIPYNTETSETKVAKTTPRWGNNISGLADITTVTGTANYKVYNNISIPLGTNHFLFYAHGTGAKTSGENPTAKDQEAYTIVENFQYGRLTPSVLTGEASTFTFSPVAIYSTNDDTQGGLLADYLTLIAKSQWTDNNNVTHKWETYNNADGGNDAISGLCATFKSLRAGSANSVLAVVEDLYNTLENYQESYKAAHSSNPDNVVAAVMTSILTRAGITSETNDDAHKGNRTLAWNTSGENEATFRGYPHNLHLPDGAAALAWQDADDGDHKAENGFPKFIVSTAYDWAANNTANLNVAPVASYIYPACLYYYANSALRSATSAKLSALTSVTTWSTALGWYNEANNTAVGANTRSVAIYDPIQYGVASVKTAVRVKDGVTELKDSRNANITMANISMTGVLIGGQKAVDFDFTPSDANGAQIIYDSIMTAVESGKAYTLSNTAYTQQNPTLVLETYPGKNVLMAVEFLNNDKDFYGKDGQLIPKGTHFYIVAELAASAATDSNAALAAAGKTNRVFAQDFTTTVNLVLKDLKKAYNVVPDLRTTALELGFSVDLTWQAGVSYTIEIGE